MKFAVCKSWWGRAKQRFSKRLRKDEKMSVEAELDAARKLGEQLEELIVRRGQCPADERSVLLIGYWAMLFDFHKAILSLIPNNLCGSAFALVRPALEALIRAHLAVKGSEEDIRSIRADEYRTNFVTIGPWIDEQFGMEKFFTNLLSKARDGLHSFTHSGLSQLSRRFDGHDLQPRYKEGEIVEVIRVSTSAVWLMTNLATKYLGFADEAKEAEELFLAWGQNRP